MGSVPSVSAMEEPAACDDPIAALQGPSHLWESFNDSIPCYLQNRKRWRARHCARWQRSCRRQHPPTHDSIMSVAIALGSQDNQMALLRAESSSCDDVQSPVRTIQPQAAQQPPGPDGSCEDQVLWIARFLRASVMSARRSLRCDNAARGSKRFHPRSAFW